MTRKQFYVIYNKLEKLLIQLTGLLNKEGVTVDNNQDIKNFKYALNDTVNNTEKIINYDIKLNTEITDRQKNFTGITSIKDFVKSVYKYFDMSGAFPKKLNETSPSKQPQWFSIPGYYMWHRYRLGKNSHLCSVNIDSLVKKIRLYCSVNNISEVDLNDIERLYNTPLESNLLELPYIGEKAFDIYYGKHRLFLHSVFQIGLKQIPTITSSLYSKFVDHTKGRSFRSPIIKHLEGIDDADKCAKITSMLLEDTYLNFIIVCNGTYGFKKVDGTVFCKENKEEVFKSYCEDKVNSIVEATPLLAHIDSFMSDNALSLLTYSVNNGILSEFIDQYEISMESTNSTEKLKYDIKYKYLKAIHEHSISINNELTYDSLIDTLNSVNKAEDTTDQKTGVFGFLLHKVINTISQNINDVIVLHYKKQLLTQDVSSDTLLEKFKQVFDCAINTEENTLLNKYCNDPESYDMASKFVNMFNMSSISTIKYTRDKITSTHARPSHKFFVPKSKIYMLLQEYKSDIAGGLDISDEDDKATIKAILPMNLVLEFKDDGIWVTYLVSIGDMKERIASLSNFLTCIDDFKQLSEGNYNVYLENSEFIQENERKIATLYKKASSALKKKYGSEYTFNKKDIEKFISDMDHMGSYGKDAVQTKITEDMLVQMDQGINQDIPDPADDLADVENQLVLENPDNDPDSLYDPEDDEEA
jgi:hypothetical protein